MRKTNTFKLRKKINRFEGTNRDLTRLFDDYEPTALVKESYAGKISGVPAEVVFAEGSWNLCTETQRGMDMAYGKYLRRFTGLREQ